MTLLRHPANWWRENRLPLLASLTTLLILLFTVGGAVGIANAATKPASADDGVKGKTFTIATDTTWAPFEFQRTQTPGSRVMWLTFSSSRRYGLRTPPPGTSPEATTGALLWMVAIDPDLAAQGQDPSYAAFCLPFQDVTTSNHIAQWTEDVVTIQ